MGNQQIDLSIKKRPRQRRAQATFSAILEATTRVLRHEGYSGLTTNRVAEVAGVSVGSLYEYFPHKQALVAAALGREIEGLTQAVQESLRVAVSLDEQPHAGIQYWIESMTELLEARADLLRIVLSEVPFLWQIPEMRQLTETLLHIAQEGRGRSRGVLHFEDPETTPWILMTMVWATLMQNVLQRPAHLTREQVTRTLVEMVLKLL